MRYSGHEMLLAIIADDLTGACDAAVHFAARGRTTSMRFDGTVSECDVAAFSTDSRDADEVTIRQRIGALSGSIQPKMLFKKIDSVLRGRPGLEIAATMDAFGYDLAVVTPAYPEMGRFVEHGLLQLPDPIDVAAKLSQDGLDPRRCLVLDAATNQDLAEIVRRFSGERILWCGSGGLALALAQTFGSGVTIPRPAPGEVCFCVGSTHEATMAQVAMLPAGAALIHIDRNSTTGEEIRSLLDRPRPGALFITGGDTASMVLAAIGAAAIRLAGEIVRGVPWGVLEGGIMDGVPVVTKSGGFGAADTLVRVAEFFLK